MVWSSMLRAFRKCDRPSQIKGVRCSVLEGRTQTLMFFAYIIYLRMYVYSGTSLLRCKSDLNGEVTVLLGLTVLFFAKWKIIWDRARVTLLEVTLLVR